MGKLITIAVTPTLDTNAYAAADQFGGVDQVLSKLKSDAVLRGVSVFDGDDQDPALDLLFFDDDPDAEISSSNNAAFAMTDAASAKLQGIVNIATGEYTDLGAQSFVYKEVNMPLRNKSGLYMAAIVRNTPTHTASGVVYMLHLEVEQI